MVVETVDLEIIGSSLRFSLTTEFKVPHSPNRIYFLKPLPQFPCRSLSSSGHPWTGSSEKKKSSTLGLKAPAVLESQERKTPFKRFHFALTGDHTGALHGNKQATHTPPPETLAPLTVNHSLSYSSTPRQSAGPRKETNACCPVQRTVLAKDSCAEPPEHHGGGYLLARLA